MDEIGCSTVRTKTPSVSSPKVTRRVTKISSTERDITVVCYLSIADQYIFIFTKVRMQPAYLDGAPAGYIVNEYISNTTYIIFGTKMPMSIFPLFLLVGVAWNFPWRLHGNVSDFQPIMSRSNQRRICVELCMSGLGGEPCGEDCVDLSPLTVPIQSYSTGNETRNKTSTSTIATPRNDSCPVLCANNLGYPLCNCQNTINQNTEVDYVQICAFFCIDYDYQLFGCQSCDIYKKLSQEAFVPVLLTSTSNGSKAIPTTNMVLSASLDPYWTTWCVDKCSVGEGGSACNCDKPVMVTLN
ncbi:hypothetical protein HHI36_002058 [Cryptolaemus montrouzieri]|uniref:Uncharacterized protein n=1 Tax=Cryptolaemus montrouzieri TaxID=559131 RepID=A0ABD2PA51_9CUCU